MSFATESLELDRRGACYVVPRYVQSDKLTCEIDVGCAAMWASETKLMVKVFGR